ncbi:glycosyltransferase [Streptomyces sp. RPT161]|uniref:glycosyltransferase n=1 Tax=Streptomyces sp. RPT161 TaxID=3015993 RepID=UPI0022B91C3D|nr:glycosyltransferase [Streptomyces sp. RPT161]
MQILIIATGTMGDVAPYTGLGLRLRQAGHQVAIATHQGFEDLIRSCGLEYRRFPGDPWRAASTMGVRVERSGTGLPPRLAVARLIPSLLRDCGQGVLDAARQGADVLLVSQGVAPLGRVVAEGLDLPSLGVFVVPLMPTASFPPVGVSLRSLGARGNRAAGNVMMSLAMRLYTPEVQRLRTELGLPRRGAGIRRDILRSWPIWHGFSRHVVPRPPDWRPGLELSGYWWPASPRQWQPPPQLVDFLGAGPPPVYVGFGSNAPSHGERLGTVVVSALRRAGVRGVVQRGWAGMEATADGDILSIGEVSHEWLFPRTAAVVHHAGAGTTSAGLRAGVPAVPVPFLFDMHFWAARLVALGVSPSVVPFCALSEERLANAITMAVRDPEHLRKARAVSCRLADEDGAAPVIEAIDNLARSA